jgi:RNA polymerase sigma-70 factor (ECF subfamily)
LAQREGAARILAAMAQLPATQRAVLALAALDDLPQTEIAVVLGVPPGTVYSRLHQARERMREALEQGGP